MPYYSYLKIAEGMRQLVHVLCDSADFAANSAAVPLKNWWKRQNGSHQKGVKELVVVAQDTTRYGEDLYGEYRLAELLRELCKIDGLRWIRTLYCYPDKITDELIDVIATEPKLVKYLDVPIQHCCGEILSRMNRPMDETSLRALFEKLRARIPGLTLRTTVMVGFPGETEEQFTSLCEFIDSVRFDRLGCFAFSPEEGTAAAQMEDQVEESVRTRREEIVMTQQSVIMEQKNEKKIGERVQVLVEGYDRYGSCYFGRTAADAPDVDGKIFFHK